MRTKVFLKAIVLSIFPLLVFAAKAPDFTVTDFNNQVHNLYADILNKDKVLVIKFFFVGCPPCATIAPYVQQAYVRWGSGTGRVQFIEISTQNDYNSLVKSYHQTKGFTFPGVGTDGGSAAARAPYVSGTFGPWYGTPTFVVINPKGDVNFNVYMSTTDQSQLDTAIAQALRVTNGGGGGGCSNAFSVKTITQLQPETYYVMDLLNGNPANEIKDGKYNCEFNLAQNIDGYYVIPQKNLVAPDPLNGITTADIVYIQRNILGLQTFNNLQRAVADVNNSGSVSAADIAEMRKLILGVTAKFSKLTKSYVVVHNPKSTNPLDLTDRVLVKDLVSQTKVNEFGVGQYGDVTGANLFTNDELVSRSSDVLKFFVKTNQHTDGSYEHIFYTNEDYNLTAFQFEIKGKTNNIINIKPSPKFSDPSDFDYNLNLSPEVLRILAAPSSGKDLHFSAGETWFTVTTKKYDHLNPSYFQNFENEFLFDQLKNVISAIEINYLFISPVVESVSLTQQNYSDIIVSSTDNINKIQIINTNGNPLLDKIYTTDTKEVKIDNSAFHPGIYFVQIQLQNGKVETKKFIKF